MLDNQESRITFEVPTDLDFDKLIRDNNYTLYWQNLHSEPYRQKISSALNSTVLGDRNSSDFNLMSSLRHFAGDRSVGGGAIGWGIAPGDGSDWDTTEGQLVDPSYLWIGAVMVLLSLSGLFCVCSCYLYYKYRKWQKCVSISTCHTLSTQDIEAPPPYDTETLPSYTIASGLPTYEDAVQNIVARQQTRTGHEPAHKTAPMYPPAIIKFLDSRPQNWLNVTVFEEIHYNFVDRGASEERTSRITPKTIVNASEVVQSHANKADSNDSVPVRIQICVLENEKKRENNR
ncbi:protein commissureless 2 homolog [Sabethes cyaneus]|uniref:protein commissureless 2 homolog n=1 Tax=Sabethes cyaneus TaxID=53552 RepID=UPI00237D8ED3|nr:protein commissureless 2 homolog [Sabethes cyaneus]